MKQIIKYIVLFVIFGVIYYGIEIWARGYSHIAMIAVGGICGIIVGLINEYFDYDMPLLLQMLAGLFGDYFHWYGIFELAVGNGKR